MTVAGAALTEMLTGMITALWPAGVIVMVAVSRSPAWASCVVAVAEVVKVSVVPQL